MKDRTNSWLNQPQIANWHKGTVNGEINKILQFTKYQKCTFFIVLTS